VTAADIPWVARQLMTHGGREGWQVRRAGGDCLRAGSIAARTDRLHDREPAPAAGIRSGACAQGGRRYLHVDLELEIDVAAGDPAAQAPVLGRSVVQHDEDVLARNAERLKSVDDVLVKSSFGID